MLEYAGEERRAEAPPDADGADTMLPATAGGAVPAESGELSALLDVSLEVEVQLGNARLPIRDLLGLTAGSVVTLDKGATDPVDIYAGGRLIARGEVVSVDGELGVRITEILHVKEQA